MPRATMNLEGSFTSLAYDSKSSSNICFCSLSNGLPCIKYKDASFLDMGINDLTISFSNTEIGSIGVRLIGSTIIIGPFSMSQEPLLVVFVFNL